MKSSGSVTPRGRLMEILTDISTADSNRFDIRCEQINRVVSAVTSESHHF